MDRPRPVPSALVEKKGVIGAEVVSTVDAIAQHSRKINCIIVVIDGIAFQISMLALNAAPDEQSAAAASSLQQHAARLSDVVQTFQLSVR